MNISKLRKYASEIAGATLGGVLVTSLERHIKEKLPEAHADIWFLGIIFGGLAVGAVFFGALSRWQSMRSANRRAREKELETLRTLNAELSTRIESTQTSWETDFSMCCIRHNSVHQMRDSLARLFPVRETYEPLPSIAGTSPNSRPPSHPGLVAMRADIVKQLAFLSEEFQTKVGNRARVFACLRELCSDEKFHTFDRAGAVDVNRDRNSAAWDKKNHRVYQRLRDRCDKSHCVILSVAGTDGFLNTEADQLKDADGFRANECMLTGAVFAKSMIENENKNSRMVWIVSVCANRPNAFQESDCEMLRFHVDLFSALLNGMLHMHDVRSSAGK